MEGLNRIIMQYEGAADGPLLIVIGALHGNEKAGIKALELVAEMLEVEPITNRDFSFKGRLVGIIGNIPATKKGVRFIDQDLNRMWNKTNVDHVLKKPFEDQSIEERELTCLLKFIASQINDYQPEELYILDLHTTSSGGGIFSIPNYDQQSLEIAIKLHAPVVLDMLQAISGTTLHYFNNKNINLPKTTSVTFEAGQHDDYISVNRCIAAIINCMKSVGCVDKEDVENIHDEILQSYSAKLPKLSRLLYMHEISPADKFIMKPGYNNFDSVRKGEILAYDRRGEIKAPEEGLILMPLYQQQGSEGFFIIRPESN